MHKLSLREVESLIEGEISTSKSAYISAMIPVAISIAENHCNKEMALRDDEGKLLKDEDGNYFVIDGSMSLFIAKLSEYYMNTAGVTYEMISRVARNYSNDIPKSIYAIIRPHVKVRFI